jgi:hypothetical protein
MTMGKLILAGAIGAALYEILAPFVRSSTGFAV